MVELSGVARAATFGAIDTVLVDIEAYVPGTIDDESGAIVESRRAGRLGRLRRHRRDRAARAADGHVLAVRGDEVPGGGPAAAILRYAV